MMRILVAILGLLAFAPQPTGWETDVTNMLSEFLSCQTPIDDQSPCNVFLARALKRVYGITDFDDPSSSIGVMTANQIANFVATDQKWTKIGVAADQATLDSAQGYANQNKAVIAVFKANPHGHVALILPGMQQLSSTWAMLMPNSASFSLDDPQASYVGGLLSKAFGADKKDRVQIYGRNFNP